MALVTTPKAGELEGRIGPWTGSTITVVGRGTHMYLLKSFDHELFNVGMVVNTVKGARWKGGRLNFEGS
jgi:hypothetical protein